MKKRYGIDTSILMRLLTGDPAKDYTKTVRSLENLLEQKPGADILASNQVIGEAYIAVRHHYGISKADARAALLSVLSSGLVAPLNGTVVLDAIRHTEGCGLPDRLIVDDYARHGVETLTHDRKMGALPDATRL
jgi:predicted nucleic acid-binding protein